MKMISGGFAGISLLILIGMFDLGEGGSHDPAIMCPNVAMVKDWKEACEQVKSGTSHEELKECYARYMNGLPRRCCKGGKMICETCEWEAEWEFNSKVGSALHNGTKPEYCNNYERPGVCGKGPTSDKDACAPGGSKGFACQLKSSFLLMLATITITLLLRPMLI